MITDQLQIHLSGTGYRLLDTIGAPEVVQFDTLAEATEEKVRRFIFKGARGLSGSETYNNLQSRIYDKVKETFMQKNKDGYCEGWCRDFDSTHVYYTNNGKTYAVAYTDNATGLSFGVPVEVRQKTVYEPVSFSFGSVAEFAKATGGYVVKEGKIFEAGDYPDKGVSISETELQEMVDGFAEVPNDLEHMDTILDGKLGALEKVWRKGAELFGRVTVPEWIADAAGEEPLKVSIALNRQKKIVGNALVLNPRVSDACIMRAFSNRQTEKGQTEGETKMKIRDLLKVFGIASATSLDEEVPEGATLSPALFAAPPSASDPALNAMEAELAKFRAAEATRRGAALDEARKLFSRSLLETGAILPKSAEAAEALYSVVLMADGKGEVTFSEGGSIVEGASVAALREVLSSKIVGPAAIAAHAFAGAPSAGDEAAVGAAAVLASTQFGRAVSSKEGK